MVSTCKICNLCNLQIIHAPEHEIIESLNKDTCVCSDYLIMTFICV